MTGQAHEHDKHDNDNAALAIIEEQSPKSQSEFMSNEDYDGKFGNGISGAGADIPNHQLTPSSKPTSKSPSKGQAQQQNQVGARSQGQDSSQVSQTSGPV